MSYVFSLFHKAHSGLSNEGPQKYRVGKNKCNKDCNLGGDLPDVCLYMTENSSPKIN